MLFAVAEKLILAAGTYPCEWTYGDEVVSGDLRLEGSRRPAGEMFDAPGTWVARATGVSSFGPHDDTVDVLPGRLRSGHQMVLLDAQVQYLLPELARLATASPMAVANNQLPRNCLR
jgi:hypothetical protein